MSTAKPWPCDPEAAWAAATPTDAPARRTPPDISDFDDFKQLAAPGKSAGASAAILTVAGVFFLAMGIVLLAFRPESSDGTDGGFFAGVLFVFRWYWVAPFAVAVWFLLSAPRAYRKESRDYPMETRDLYEASRVRGVTVETCSARFRIYDASEGTVEAEIGVDVRLDAAQAERIRQAFRTWFEQLKADRTSTGQMRDQHGPKDVRPAEDFFGPEAVGGYLMRQIYAPERFVLLVPDPPHSTEAWARWRIKSRRAPSEGRQNRNR